MLNYKLSKKSLFLSIVIIVVMVLIFGANNILNANSVKASKLDIVLLIDQSGSMRNSDPKKLRCDAARLFVNLCSENDRIAVVGFGNDAVQLYPQMVKTENGLLRKSFEPTNNANKLKIIETINKNIKDNDNYTSIHRALEEALAILKFNKSLGSSDSIPIVIMLTDGQIKGAGDLPPGTTLEKANASIDNSIADFARYGVRIMTIGLGDNYDHELLNKISLETNGAMYETKNPSLLVDAYRKIFLDISNRFMFISSMKGDSLKYSYPVSPNEKDAVVLIANKNVSSENNFVINKSLSINNQKIASFFEDKSVLYDFSRIFNPINGKMMLDYKFSSNINFDLFLIKNIALHINMLEPQSVDSEYYDGDTVPVKVQLYRIDGISIANTKFQIKLTINAPDGTKEEIELDRNGDLFLGGFVPKMPGIYKLNFVTKLLEDNYSFDNVKEISINILQKSALTVKIKEPSVGLFKYTTGSNLDVAAEILVNGYAVPDDLKNLSVRANLSVDNKIIEEIELEKNTSGLYKGRLNLKVPGKIRLKMIAAAPKCKTNTAEFDIDVIAEPTLNFITPVNNNLYKTTDSTVKVKVGGIDEKVNNTLVVSGVLINKIDSSEIALKFKKSNSEDNVYEAVVSSFKEGIYQINASMNFLNKTISVQPLDFYVYDIDSPKLGVFPEASSARKPLLVTAKISGKSGSNYGTRINCEIVKPRKSMTAKEQIIKLELKDDGKNGDKKAGDNIYSALFSDTSSLGTYEFRGRAYYSGLQIPEEYKSYNAVNTVKVGICYYIEVEESKRIASDTGKTYFDMDVLKNDAGCSGSGNFVAKIKVNKAKRYSITFKMPNNDDIDVYYSESGKEPVHEFSDKLNETSNIYIFTYEVKRSDRNIAVPVEIVLHDEEGKLKDASEKIYIKGKTYIPMSPWLIIIALIIIFLIAKRYFIFSKQEFPFEIEILDKSKSVVGHVKNSQIIKKLKIPFSKVINLFGSNKIEFAFNINTEKLKNHEPSVVEISSQARHFKVLCIDSNENKWQIKMNKSFDNHVAGEKWYKKAKFDKEPFNVNLKVTIEDGLEIYMEDFIIKFNK